MSIVRYTANSQFANQIDAYVVASPLSGTTNIAVVCNGKTFNYPAVSSVAADVATAFATAFNQQENIRELLDFPVTSSGANVYFTSSVAGKPFTMSASQTAGGGGTFNGSTTTANSGGGVFDTAANWSATINIGDALVLSIPDADINYRLDQLTTSIVSFTMRSTFSGSLGLPIQSEGGYPEYRACYAKLVCPLYLIGVGDGPGCSRAYIESNAGAAAKVVVFKTGSSQDQYNTVLLKHTAGGSNSFSEIRVHDGSVGVALLPGEASTVTLLNIGGDSTSPDVDCGVGVTLTTLTISSGDCTLVSSASGTTKITGGAAVHIANGGNATAINVDAGRCDYGGDGSAYTITTLTIGEAGIFDLSQGTGAVTVTNPIVIYQGAQIIDPLNRLATGTVFSPQNGVLTDFTYDGTPGITWTKS